MRLSKVLGILRYQADQKLDSEKALSNAVDYQFESIEPPFVSAYFIPMATIIYYIYDLQQMFANVFQN